MTAYHHTITRTVSGYGDTRATTISLPAIPGITMAIDRPETKPTSLMVRSAKPSSILTGAAAVSAMDRRLDAIAGAIIAARADLAREVTL